MSNEIRGQIGKIIAFTAEYYGKEMKREVISMMVDDLIDLPLNEVIKAYGDYRRDPKNRTMPLPAQIRAIVAPEPDTESMSREIVARILEAQDRFGYTWPAEAKQFIGEVGWSVVRAYGGWENFCSGLGQDFTVDAFSAQARELLKGRITYGEKLGKAATQIPYKNETLEITGSSDSALISLPLNIKTMPKD